jgi:riboflavin kinase/FMN adenylyltransferase
MRVYRSMAELTGQASKRRAVSLGVFDGVHRGHAAILAALKHSAADAELDSALVLTFQPHPLCLVNPDRAPRMILTLDERLAELERLGLEEVLVLEFTPELAQTSYERFTQEILVAGLGLEILVAGYDFHLGHGRKGSGEAMAALGERLGFRVEILSPCYLDGGIISSTRIRRDLLAGRMEAVQRALGHPFPLGGELRPGQGKGRELGAPTANLSPPPPEKAVPPPGVYLVRARVGASLRAGLMNLGWAPTLRNSYLPEVHLIDFEGTISEPYLELHVLKRLRAERRFPDATALAAQIQRDLDAARRILATELLEEP